MSQAFSLGGSLNLGQGGNISQGLQGFKSDYNSALGAAQSNYNAIISGYNTTLQSQMAAENKLIPQYGQLENKVLGTIQGITASQKQAIQDTYAQQWGQQSQGLINAGLGNTTVQQSLQRGMTLDEQKAQVALANQQAQLTAGYQSQLGLAGLQYQNQAIQQNSALASQALNTRAGFQIPFPTANPYMQMFALQQARAQPQGTTISNPGMSPYNTPNPQTSNPYGAGMGSYGGYGGGYAASQEALGGGGYGAGMMASIGAGQAGLMGSYGNGVYGDVGDFGGYDLSAEAGS